MLHAKSLLCLLLIVVHLVLTGCSPATVNAKLPASSPSPEADLNTSTPLPPPIPTATPTNLTVWISPDLPENFQQSIKLPDTWSISKDQNTSGFAITSSGEQPAAHWVYTLVAPFPTITDNISLENLKASWINGQSNTSSFQNLLIDHNTYLQFKRLWGEPNNNFVQIAEQQEDIQQHCWDKKTSWSIVPFDKLNPRWKVIQIDNQSPIQQQFDATNYPLQAAIFIQSPSKNTAQMDELKSSLPATNRDDKKITSLAMTGVTALVRATAAFMEYRGITYPGQDIRQLLRDANITIVSNEVAFAKNCPTPIGTSANLKFCSKPKYIDLLEDIGTDLVDMSGDHLSDWSDEAFLYTLDLYQQKGWKVFGGGANSQQARSPVFAEDHGNRFAFLSCNAKARGYAQAAENHPGAIFCNMEYLNEQVKELSAKGYIVMVNFQHQEFSAYKPIAIMETDFRNSSTSGATIVTGTQAHQPQTMEFDGNHFIHYGLGNLFFDQYYEGLPNRQAFIDRHIFYNGQYINTELITIMFIDYARPRFMTPEERTALLTLIFKESNWNPELEKK